MHYIPYNSRKDYHKTPFGAVAAGSETTFRVILPRAFDVRRVWLAVRYDTDGEHCLYPLERERLQGDSEEWWRGVYTPEETGLAFYHFAFETPCEHRYIYHAGGGLGKITDSRDDWQLTVYSPGFKTPDWLKGGVIYQIFPDRFCRSGRPKAAVSDDRILRADWGGEPMWEPDERGNINRYDYFGGDLAGIAEKLSHLAALGVTCVYLTPIFEAHSNHRYDTADYCKIDPLLGDEDDFRALCALAGEKGIRIILDGVFSHTGADSVYFNKNKRYPANGAYNSKQSPYYAWYKFNRWPDSYTSWWGIEILPEINEDNPGFIEFITGENGVAKKWLEAGAGGWRLDVADELPDKFLEAFRKAVKSVKEDAYILGEVWEDASNKYSYGSRRRYLQGSQVDSVMNYPFSNALLAFIQNGSAETFLEKVLTILENYPPEALHTLMNHIGTHDTVRALSLLGGAPPADNRPDTRALAKLTPPQRSTGLTLMKLISAVQFTLPGIPGIYYGDEAGLEGGRDPFNRGCYPWGTEDQGLLAHYQTLGAIRKNCPALTDGNFETVHAADGCLAFTRTGRGNAVLTVANRGDHETTLCLDEKWNGAAVLLGGGQVCGGTLRVQALEALILSLRL